MAKPTAFSDKLSHVLGLRRSRALGWVRQGLAAIADQGIASAASLLVTIQLARWLTLEEYGGYALALSAFQFALQVQNGMILEPMSVLGPGPYDTGLRSYLTGQFRLGFLVVSSVGAVVLILALFLGGLQSLKAAVGPLLAVGFALPLTTLPWMIRRLLYILGRPAVAAAASVCFACVLVLSVIALEALDWLLPSTAIAAQGLAGLSTVAFALPYLLKGSRIPSPPSPRALLLENWSYGKWSTLGGFLVATAVQAQLFIVSGLLGLAAAGVVKAAQNLIQPMVISITAISALALPSMSRDEQDGRHGLLLRKTRLMTGALLIAALLYYAALLTLREQVMELAYGAHYLPFAAVLIFWGLIPVIMALNAGIGVILRARQLPHLVFIVSLVWAVVSLGLGIWLSRVAGIAGASASAVLGYAVAGSATILLYGRSSRGQETPAQRPGESPE